VPTRSFSLGRLLFCVTVFAVALALVQPYGQAGFIAATLIGFGAGGLTLVGCRGDIRRVLISVTCTLGFGFFLAAILLPAVQAERWLPVSWAVAFCLFVGWTIGGLLNATYRPKLQTRDLVSPLFISRRDGERTGIIDDGQDR
jgi:hypothetical protein